MRHWTFGYVWKDTAGEIQIHEEDVVLDRVCGFLHLHIPADHAIGLMAGPWLNEKDEP